MTTPLNTIGRIEQLLEQQRTECAWDAPAYSRSQYNYVSKQFINALKGALAHLKDDVAFLAQFRQQVEAETARAERAAIDAALAKESEGFLRAEVRRLNAEVEALKAQDLNPPLTMLRRLRGLFGRVVPRGEVEALLRDADVLLNKEQRP